MKYPFITIVPRSTQTQISSTCVRIPASAALCVSYKPHVENLCVAVSSERQVHWEKK